MRGKSGAPFDVAVPGARLPHVAASSGSRVVAKASGIPSRSRIFGAVSGMNGATNSDRTRSASQLV